MSHPEPSDTPSADNAPATSGSAPAPSYKKPKVRRYDQIEQVKPYGPSEMEAG